MQARGRRTKAQRAGHVHDRKAGVPPAATGKTAGRRISARPRTILRRGRRRRPRGRSRLATDRRRRRECGARRRELCLYNVVF